MHAEYVGCRADGRGNGCRVLTLCVLWLLWSPVGPGKHICCCRPDDRGCGSSLCVYYSCYGSKTATVKTQPWHAHVLLRGVGMVLVR